MDDLNISYVENLIRLEERKQRELHAYVAESKEYVEGLKHLLSVLRHGTPAERAAVHAARRAGDFREVVKAEELEQRTLRSERRRA